MYYRVKKKFKIPSEFTHHDFGCEDKYEFFEKVRKRAAYAERVGMMVNERDDRIWLRLCGWDGRLTREELDFPKWMLEKCAPPIVIDDDDDLAERELNRIFYFE